MRPLLSAVVLRAQSDERLVALAREGHDQAFVAIAQRYRRELLAYARRAVGVDRAEDVVQQAMLSAWSALRREADVENARAWLHRIVHNAAVRAAQRTERHEQLTEGLAVHTPADTTAELRLNARQAMAAMAALPDSQRRALELTALGDASGREAAAALGVSEGALRQLVHRARTVLRSGVAALTPESLVSWAAAGNGESVATRVTELTAGAGLAATVAKVCGTAALTASVLGGASQLLPAGNHHHSGARNRPAPAGQRAAARPAQGNSSPAYELGSSGAGGGKPTLASLPVGRAAIVSASQPAADAGAHRPISDTGSNHDGGNQSGTSGHDQSGTSGHDQSGTSGHEKSSSANGGPQGASDGSQSSYPTDGSTARSDEGGQLQPGAPAQQSATGGELGTTGISQH